MICKSRGRLSVKEEDLRVSLCNANIVLSSKHECFKDVQLPAVPSSWMPLHGGSAMACYEPHGHDTMP